MHLNPGLCGPDVTGLSQAQTPTPPWVPLRLTCECRARPAQPRGCQTVSQRSQPGWQRPACATQSARPGGTGDTPARKHRGGEIAAPELPCDSDSRAVVAAPGSVCSRCEAAFWGPSQLSVGGSLARGFGEPPHLSDLSVPSGLSMGWPFPLRSSRPVPNPRGCRNRGSEGDLCRVRRQVGA